MVSNAEVVTAEGPGTVVDETSVTKNQYTSTDRAQGKEEEIDVVNEDQTGPIDELNDINHHSSDSSLQPETEPQDSLSFLDFRKAVISGDITTVMTGTKLYSQWVHQTDPNGWQVLNEALRSGQTEVVFHLLAVGGADANRSSNSKGSTPLYWARYFHEEDHPIVQIVKDFGGSM
mmetsp:Transcript_26001/g.29942  ORF Transcript_26001/g.29942 Transcript_26001/m.29942 type:complete len:175 (+) Transcript_26001:1708-2232(+)